MHAAAGAAKDISVPSQQLMLLTQNWLTYIAITCMKMFMGFSFCIDMALSWFIFENTGTRHAGKYNNNCMLCLLQLHGWVICSIN